MDELKEKQKKTKKTLWIITIILGIICIILLIGSVFFYIGYKECSNSSPTFYSLDSGPVSGWANLANGSLWIGSAMLLLVGFLCSGGLSLIIIMSITVMWIIYAVHYKGKNTNNNINKNQ